MALHSGVRLGPYEVVGALGAGGMGEVYKARDTRLNRTVALKILPADLAADPQFRERFEREARSVSQLSHPNICTLHDVGKTQGSDARDIDFLVLEYLEGQTLAARLQRGPLAVSEAIRIASEVASALETAHRQGVVHRDLKPGNIMLTRSGAKLLDFGLAKVATATVVNTAALPTEVASITTQGTILGTLQYMAPEQIEGAEVDARADLFALGNVLYEMLTGRAPFKADSHAGLVGAILKDDPPPIGQIRPIPAALEHLVGACLAKDPDERIQSAHDVLLQLKWAAEAAGAVGAAPGPATAGRKQQAVWIAAAIGGAVLASAATWWLKPAPPDPHVAARFSYVLPPNQTYFAANRHAAALSPDGRKIAYTANRQLYLRNLDQLEGQPVHGTADAAVAQEPVFSPDGLWIAYFTIQLGAAPGTQQGFNLRRVAVSGGAPVTLGQIAGPPFGVSWRNGMILIGRGAAGIEAIPEAGGKPRTVVTVDPKSERAVQPFLLADGRHVMFSLASSLNVGRETGTGEGPIVVQALDGGPRKVLVGTGANPMVLPTGHLVYVHDRTLLAVPFDESRLDVTGTPVPIIEGIEQSGGTGGAQFTVSETGVLAYLPIGFTSTARQLVWVDRDAREQVIPAPVGSYQQPRLSPDGTRLVVSYSANLSIWSFVTDTMMRLTNEPEAQYNPAWTPDGLKVIYDSNDGSGVRILRRAADGTGRGEVVAPAPAGFPDVVSADGSFLILHTADRTAMLLPLRPPGPARRLLTDVAASVSDVEISPDGRWIAYESNESGRFEVRVRSFPAVDAGQWQVSSTGGLHPRWSRDGRELFFIAADGMMMSVPITPGPAFTHGRPVPLFPAGQYHVNVARNYDVSLDGKRFLMVKIASAPGTRTSMVVVTHWFDEVRAKMGAK